VEIKLLAQYFINYWSLLALPAGNAPFIINSNVPLTELIDVILLHLTQLLHLVLGNTWNLVEEFLQI